MNSYQPKKIEWSENQTSGRKINKNTTSKSEAKQEVSSQRKVALSLLCGENANDMIPDILSEKIF